MLKDKAKKKKQSHHHLGRFKLTEGGGRHGLGVHGWLSIGGGEVWPGVVPALVVVVLDVEAGELGEADSQGAASVVDVLSIQGLERQTGGVRQLADQKHRGESGACACLTSLAC